MATPRRQTDRLRMGALPARSSVVLNSYVRERFTKCPCCEPSTRVRKLPLVVHVELSGGPKLVLLNKTCRLCLMCETLIIDRRELERALIDAPLGAAGTPPYYVVLGTIDRRTWRLGVGGQAALPDSREHMADFKTCLKIDIVLAHRERSKTT